MSHYLQVVQHSFVSFQKCPEWRDFQDGKQEPNRPFGGTPNGGRPEACATRDQTHETLLMALAQTDRTSSYSMGIE